MEPMLKSSQRKKDRPHRGSSVQYRSLPLIRDTIIYSSVPWRLLGHTTHIGKRTWIFSSL
jgi:hypothetical protein